jgi:hypothetical protein
MFIEINNSKRVVNIQRQFANMFPYLKLEFFPKVNEPGTAIKQMPYRPDMCLSDISNKHVQGIININPDNEIYVIEDEFARRFGLHVQIYRLLLDKWIQTEGMERLTLDEQNELAKDSVVFYKYSRYVS